MRNKNKWKPPFSHSLSSQTQLLVHNGFSLSLLPLLSSSAAGWGPCHGMQSFWSCASVVFPWSSIQELLHHGFFPWSVVLKGRITSVCYPHWAEFPTRQPVSGSALLHMLWLHSDHIDVLLCPVFHGLHVEICFAWCPMGYRQTASVGLQANFCSVPGVPPTLLHWPWCLQRSVSQLWLLTWLLHGSFLSFLKYVITDVQAVSLTGSALTSDGSLLELEPACAWHEAAPALFSQSLPMQPPSVTHILPC